MNSVVSDSTAVAPMSTSRSQASPIRGLEARPLVWSEPPHSVPTISSLMGNFSRCSRDASCAILLAARVARSTVAMVPPFSWITKRSSGLLVRFSISSATRSI